MATDRERREARAERLEEWSGKREARAEASVSVTCSAEGCSARFFHVPGREFPGLCLDHAADAARERHGWTPANSLS